MKYYLLKAQAKKTKWNKRNIDISEDESVSSSEDEDDYNSLFNIIVVPKL